MRNLAAVLPLFLAAVAAAWREIPRQGTFGPLTRSADEAIFANQRSLQDGEEVAPRVPLGFSPASAANAAARATNRDRGAAQLGRLRLPGFQGRGSATAERREIFPASDGRLAVSGQPRSCISAGNGFTTRSLSGCW